MGDQWSYKPNDKYKSTRTLIHLLVDIVSKGGNFLLNVGPDADGQFPPAARAPARDRPLDARQLRGDLRHAVESRPTRKAASAAPARAAQSTSSCWRRRMKRPRRPGSRRPALKQAKQVRMLGAAEAVAWSTNDAGASPSKSPGHSPLAPLRPRLDARGPNRMTRGQYQDLMNRILCILLLWTLGLAGTAAAEPDTIAALPKLASGVPAYPAPFLAVARTPYRIAPLAGKAIDIQTDFGYPAGFSGFVDASIGSVGYPGYRNFSNLDIAYDSEKLCLLFCVPYPVGRKTRANATEPSDALAADDVFEVLIDPRDDQGARKAPSIASSAMPAACARSIATCPRSGNRTSRGRRG